MKKKLWLIFFLSITILVITFPDIGYPVRATLDGGYQYALNRIFTDGIQIGREVIFSYGPLGFLHYPQPIANNLLIGIIFWSLIKLGFIAGLLTIIFSVKKRRFHIVWIILAILFANFIDVWSLPTFLLIELIILYRLLPKYGYLAAVIILSSLTMLIKINYLPIHSSILAVFSADLIFVKKKHGLGDALIIILATPLLFMLFWILSQGSISGIAPYLKGMSEISAGNSSAMTVSPANNWSLLLSFLTLYFLLPVFLGENTAIFLFFLTIIPFFLTWKYTFSREDGPHLFNIVNFVLYYYLLILASIKRINLLAIICMILSLTFISYHMVILPRFGEPRLPANILGRFANFSGPYNFYRQVLKFSQYSNSLVRLSRENVRPFVLDEEIIKVINGKTVDIYPWDLSYIYANNLNWKPKPLLQSYLAFTPWLDEKDAQFFSSINAPQYLIWTYYHWGGETGSIDGRYLLNDEPLAVMAILNNYQLAFRGEKTALFKKSTPGMLGEEKPIKRSIESWNQWITVPLEAGVVRANIIFNKSLPGKIKRIVWKEDETFIEYRIKSGIKRFRLVPDNIINGLWVSPLLNQITPEFSGETVEAIRLIHGNKDYIENNMEINWIYYPFLH